MRWGTVLLIVVCAASNLAASAGISGRVVEAGNLRPVADATVITVNGQGNTSTDSAGYFIITVDPGAHLVWAYARGLSARPRRIVVDEHELARNVTLILDSLRTDDALPSAVEFTPNVRADYHITGRSADEPATVSVAGSIESTEGGAASIEPLLALLDTVRDGKPAPATAGRAYRLNISAVHTLSKDDPRVGAGTIRFNEGVQAGTQYMGDYLTGRTGAGKADMNRKTVAVAVAAATTGVVAGMVLASPPYSKGKVLPALPIGLVSLLAVLVPPRVEVPLRLWDDGRTPLTFEYTGAPLPTPVSEYKSRWSRSYVPDSYVCGFYLGCRNRNARSRRETLIWGGATWALLSAVALVDYAVAQER